MNEMDPNVCRLRYFLECLQKYRRQYFQHFNIQIEL